MKGLIFALLFFLSAAALADQTTPVFKEAYNSASNIQIYKIALESVNGSIDYTSDGIYGKLNKISYVNLTDTNFNSTINGTLYINATEPYFAAVTSYNLAGGNGSTAFVGTSRNMSILSGPLTFECIDADLNETLEVWVFVER